MTPTLQVDQQLAGQLDQLLGIFPLLQGLGHLLFLLERIGQSLDDHREELLLVEELEKSQFLRDFEEQAEVLGHVAEHGVDREGQALLAFHAEAVLDAPPRLAQVLRPEDLEVVLVLVKHFIKVSPSIRLEDLLHRFFDLGLLLKKNVWCIYSNEYICATEYGTLLYCSVLYLKSSNNKVKMWNNLQQRYTAKIHAITNVCSKETNTRPQSYC